MQMYAASKSFAMQMPAEKKDGNDYPINCFAFPKTSNSRLIDYRGVRGDCQGKHNHQCPTLINHVTYHYEISLITAMMDGNDTDRFQGRLLYTTITQSTCQNN
jgi:hypothetical protein